MKNWLRVTICIILIVSVLAMSLSVFGAGEELALLNETEVLYYIWQFLKAWGITIEYTQSLGEYSQEVEAWLKTQVDNYLVNQKAGLSFAKWIFPWTFNSDLWGYLQGNENALEDIQDFVDWLITEFALASNTINQVQDTFRYVTDIEGNIYFAGEEGPLSKLGTPLITVAGESIDEAYDKTIFFSGGVILRIYKQSGSRYLNYDLTDSMGFHSSGGILNLGFGNNLTAFKNVRVYLFYHEATAQHDEGIWFNVKYYQDGSVERNQTSWIYNFTTYYNTHGVQANNDVIVLPDDDPNYTPGDSIVIVGGEPEYLVIEWPESIEVSNLPAVVSTSDLDNPHLEEAYRPIQTLINMSKDGVSMITSLLYEMPDEMVYMWYGLLASIIVWGMIKLMREH